MNRARTITLASGIRFGVKLNRGTKYRKGASSSGIQATLSVSCQGRVPNSFRYQGDKGGILWFSFSCISFQVFVEGFCISCQLMGK